MENMMEDTLQTYTLNDLIRILRISRRTLYKYIKLKKLKAYKLGGSYRVSTDQLQAFLHKMESGKNS